MKRTLMTLAVFSLTSASYASQVAGAWYFGRWSCVIDGRAAQMVWEVVDDSRTSCNGDTCSTSSGAAIRGWFKDGNGPWVKLTDRSAVGPDLRFTYTGDNTRWFLRYNRDTRVANGNTVWRGNAYPLNCVQGRG
ncbi:DUF6006 family protein [Deinococcus hopiensis]|uniref:Uncharacterized protein n=1 Tax=Deinococcus hopiensis KR-140 TaxID=695939 RepID=A0A1W1UPW5_9DEIO|nr:DUF6006 family protein [Deinococcus hopiensis]SMB83039.1 hypothetical protein SAMN00790413_04238 [Deinococcus hopiensis KR-140]